MTTITANPAPLLNYEVQDFPSRQSGKAVSDTLNTPLHETTQNSTEISLPQDVFVDSSQKYEELPPVQHVIFKNRGFEVLDQHGNVVEQVPGTSEFVKAAVEKMLSTGTEATQESALPRVPSSHATLAYTKLSKYQDTNK